MKVKLADVASLCLIPLFADALRKKEEKEKKEILS
jgi:hypothetical protein